MAKELHPVDEAALRGAADIAGVDLALFMGNSYRAEIGIGDAVMEVERWTVDNFITSTLDVLRCIKR